MCLGDSKVGAVSVSRQGLYYRFSCRCRLTGEVMYRLMLCTDAVSENLGLLTPMDGCFGLETGLPVKRAGQGSPRFVLKPRRSPVGDRFVPVRPEEPFRYLSRLEQAYLSTQDQQLGLVFAEEK